MPKPCGCSVGGSVNGGRSGSPTRHEPNTRRARRSPSRVWMVDGGRPSSRWPHADAVERDLVRPHGPLVEIAQHDERVVVALDAERALARVEHGDLAGRVRLDPDSRLRTAGVA